MEKDIIALVGNIWNGCFKYLKIFESRYLDVWLGHLNRMLAKRLLRFKEENNKPINRILVLDDHVPDPGISSAREVYDKYNEILRNPSVAQNYTFIFKLIKILRISGFTVDSTDNPERAFELLKKRTYSSILLDLGWYDDDKQSYDYNRSAGWKLVDKIKSHTSTPVVMLSNRIYDDQGLAEMALERHLMPVFKSYDDECIKHITVTVRTFTTSTSLEDILKTRPKLLAVRMYKLLSRILSYSVLGSLALLAVSFVLIYFRFDAAALQLSLFVTVFAVLNYVIHRQSSLFKAAILDN